MSQEETELRLRMVAEAKRQGFWSRNVNDRFISGYPDMRLGKKPYGQIDFELKVLDCALKTWHNGDTVKSGLRKLQEIELRDMNAAGARAVGLVLVKPAHIMIFCNYQEIDLGDYKFAVPYSRLPLAKPCIDYDELMWKAIAYLKEQGIE